MSSGPADLGRIVVCGEALIDLVATGPHDFVARPGGSPANVAVGLSRLDVPTSLLARIAGDDFGRMLREHLVGNDVGLEDAIDADEHTTVALATLDARGGARYAFYVQGTADWQWGADELPGQLSEDVRALHVGSLALAIAPGAAHIEKLMRAEYARGEVLVSLDPNVRPDLFGPHRTALARAERQVALADLVKVSSEDLEWLYPGRSIGEIAQEWLALGPALVVVTEGAGGASALGRRSGAVRVPAMPVEVVDTVGAGDAFTAGMLAAARDHRVLHPELLADLSEAQIEDILRRAVRVSALTCAKRGADPPSLGDLEVVEPSTEG